jgi:polyisoprenoid-binding protein YceI
MHQHTILICLLAALCGLGALACQPDDGPKATAVETTSQRASEAPAPGNIKSGDRALRATTQDSKLSAWGSYVEGHRGLTFTDFDANLTLRDGRLTALDFSFDLPSASGEDKALADKLRSDYFFDASKTARPSFRLTSIDADNPKAAGGLMLQGELTLRGQTRAVSFPADVEIADDGVSFKATFPIPRGDFGIPDPGAESPEIASKNPDIYLSMELSFPNKN